MERDLVMKAYRADRVRQVREARRAVKLAWAGGFFDDLDGVARWPEEGGQTFAEHANRANRATARAMELLAGQYPEVSVKARPRARFWDDPRPRVVLDVRLRSADVRRFNRE
jgi:hypothetical protein